MNVPTDHRLLVGAVAVCAALAAPGHVAAQVDRPEREIELVPREGMSFGSAYNTIREYALPRSSCVEFTLSEATTVERGSPSQESFWKRIESNATMARHMNMSIDAHLRALTGGGTYESDSKIALLNETRSHSHAVNLFGSVVVKYPKLMLEEGSYRLTDDALRVLEEEGERAFELRCGDAFVAGVTRGYEFHARAHLEETGRQRLREAKQATDQGWDAAQFDISFLFQRGKRLETSTDRSDFEIKVVRTDPHGGVRTNPTTFAQLERQFQQFMTNASTPPPMEQNVIRLHLVPYTLAANYPGEDFAAVLEPPTRQDQLATMIGALWDLRALREDAAFMRERPAAFAMGWRESTVQEWDRWLGGLQDDWLEEFQALRDRAQACRSAGEGETDAWDRLRCSDIAAAYDREEGSRRLLAERSLLPDRKTSACGAPIPLDLQENKTGPYPEVPLGFVLTHDDGRNEIDDDLHKRLRAELAVRVEQDGRLARLLLDARLEDCKLEGDLCRKDRNNWRTALRGRVDKLLFDLDAPSPDGDAVSGMDQGTFDDLSECVFHETGPLAIEPLRRDGERWVYGLVDDTLSARSVRRCRPNRTKGCMDPTLLDQVPAERKHQARGQGALRALTCAIDLQGRRDRRLACVGLPRSGLKLALVNTLDLAAERTDPPAPRPVSLPHYSRGGGPIPVPVPLPMPGGADRAEAGPAIGQRYRIRSAATGKFIAVSGGKRGNGANVIQWEDAGQRDIVWEVRPGPGGSIKLRNANSGKFLAISGGKAVRGQSAIQWEDAGQRDVLWVPVPAGDGTYRLRNRGTDLFLGVEGRKRANGADIIQFHTRANRAMRWRFVPAGSR